MKLSKAQLEILNLMNSGWELGQSSTIDGGCYLQKGGLGKGGELKSVRSNTVFSLREYDLIRQIYSFPSSKYVFTEKGKTFLGIETKEPTGKILTEQPKDKIIDADEVATHESYGMLHFGRATVGGKGSSLFGSSILHHNIIRMAISTGEYHRGLSSDRFSERNIILEADMSPTQFADAITSLNQGGGIPITFKLVPESVKLKKVEECPFVGKIQQFNKEFEEQISGVAKRLDEVITLAEDTNAQKKLIREIKMAKQNIEANMPFINEQFTKQMADTIKEAKGEIEAFVNNLVHHHGIEAIRSQAPQITEGDTKELIKGEDNGTD